MAYTLNMTHNLDWTHKSISIIDIRKLNKLYVIKINDPLATAQIDAPLFVKDSIFEERLKSYFLKDMSQISRDDILAVKWNMYITQSYFIKINESGNVEKFYHDVNKWYISYLDIEGSLGSFSAIYRDKELNKQ